MCLMVDRLHRNDSNVLLRRHQFCVFKMNNRFLPGDFIVYESHFVKTKIGIIIAVETLDTPAGNIEQVLWSDNMRIGSVYECWDQITVVAR